MGITADGWLDWAVRLPATKINVNGWSNSGKGVFMHSAEGYASTLLSPTSIYGYNGQHSWHLSNCFDGKVYQHYPFNAQCWHASAANNTYIGVENEGYAPNDPTLIPVQIQNAVRFISEISAWKGWRPTRPTSSTDTSHTLWEHNEVVRIGGTATACPSGRIPWDAIMAGLSQPIPTIRRHEMRVIKDHTGAAYLIYADQMAFIPSQAIYDDIVALVYGPGPHQVSLETWTWLQAGEGQGARLVRVF